MADFFKLGKHGLAEDRGAELFQEMIKQESRGYEVSKILMLTFFAVFLLLPIARVMSSMTMETLMATIRTGAFKAALRRSLTVASVGMVLAISIAYVSAWAVTRTAAPLKSFFTIVLTLPMLIPSYSHASGLVLLFGQTEYIQNQMAGRGVLTYIIASVGINAVVEMAVAALVTGAVGVALRKAKLI